MTATTFTQPDPINLTWDNPQGLNHLVVVETAETNLVPTTLNTNFGNGFRNAPIRTDAFSLRSRSFSYFGMNRVILFTINSEYLALYNATNNSSQNLTGPSTNISNGFGIFTGVSSDTLLINVKKQ